MIPGSRSPEMMIETLQGQAKTDFTTRGRYRGRRGHSQTFKSWRKTSTKAHRKKWSCRLFDPIVRTAWQVEVGRTSLRKQETKLRSIKENSIEWTMKWEDGTARLYQITRGGTATQLRDTVIFTQPKTRMLWMQLRSHRSDWKASWSTSREMTNYWAQKKESRAANLSSNKMKSRRERRRTSTKETKMKDLHPNPNISSAKKARMHKMLPSK